MRLLCYALLTTFLPGFFFTSCKKESTGRLVETNYVDTDTILDRRVAGPLRITVYKGSITGDWAKGAEVKLAHTFDSVNNEQYFISKTTNDSGYVIFNDLPVDSITRKKTYYANAFLTIDNQELSSVNGNGSNGPLGIYLTQEKKEYWNIIITQK